MLAVPTPGAPQATRTLARPTILPSPLGDRVGYSDHDRFRGYFPVHFIPAYNLPVYASQWPLPDTTQDSVRGCSLGFTAAAIPGDRVQRTWHGATPTERSVRISRTTHSTASAYSLPYGRRSFGFSNGVRSLIWWKAFQVRRRPAQLRQHNILRQ